MKLFQFWDADPPADVAGFMDAARAEQTAFDYVRFDARSGRDFVGDHYGARGLAVWDACALPAMWSDFLRLLLMDTYGGVYADATYRLYGDLSDFVATAPVGQLPYWQSLVNNNYMMFHEPGHPFVKACIALVMENVEQRRFGSVLMAMGPGALNSVRCVATPENRPAIDGFVQFSPEWLGWGWSDSVAAAERLIEPSDALTDGCRGITLVPLDDLHKAALSWFDTEHRRADTHWLKWKQSIYR